MGTWGPDLPSGGGNYLFGGDVIQTIRLSISMTRTPQSQHHFSSGYQPCAAQLTSPRRLSPASDQEHKQGQGRTQLNCRNTWIKHTKLGFYKLTRRWNCSWQNNLSKTRASRAAATKSYTSKRWRRTHQIIDMKIIMSIQINQLVILRSPLVLNLGLSLRLKDTSREIKEYVLLQYLRLVYFLLELIYAKSKRWSSKGLF